MSSKTLSETQAAKNLLLSALARREYGAEELLFKYRERAAPEALRAALAELQQSGAQSDARYLASEVRQATARGKGPRWILQKIRRHAVDETLLTEALAAVDFFALAAAVCRKKYPHAPQNARERAQRMRFLAGRGFLPPHIYHALHND